jgi:hypothetical protein
MQICGVLLPDVRNLNGTNEMLKRLGPGLFFAASLAGAAFAQGGSRFDGQYVGQMTLKGVIKGDCTTPPLGAEYPLSVAGGVVRYKYVPRFDTTLSGRVDDKGNFKATRQLRHGVVTMTGHIDPPYHLTAEIVSPSCRYTFETR